MRTIEFGKKSRILLIFLIALFMQMVLPTHAYALEEDKKQEIILVEEPSIIDDAINKKDEPIVIPSNNLEKQEGNNQKEELSREKVNIKVETPQEDAANDVNKQEGEEVPKEKESPVDNIDQTEESKDKDRRGS